MPLPLFPVPRSLTETGGTADLSAPPRIAEDPTLPPQGYRLTGDADGVRIEHRDDAGLRYARQTLDQLAGGGDPVPAVRIEDWPDFATRIYMLDISRNRVPTRACLQRYVEICETARYNQLQLYTEHTYAYTNHEEVWRDASPMTADDMRWLDALCAEHGIELVTNINSFGHFERWLEHPSYRHRAEQPEGFEIWGGHHPASLLAPTDDNAALVRELARELLGVVRSRKINIGGDETFELGQGRSKADVEARGRGRVYVDHMKKIIDPLAAEGYDVQFWADVIRNDPALYKEFAGRPTPIAWTYDAPQPARELTESERAMAAELETFGVDIGAHTEGFAGNVKPLADNGIPFWVAAGTSAWSSLVGKIDNSQGNVVDAAQVGLANGSTGFMITDWGDFGRIEPPSISFGPIVFAGGASWCLSTNQGVDLADVLSRHVFDDPTGAMGRAVVDLGTAWRIPDGIPAYTTLSFRALTARAKELPAFPRERIDALVATYDRALAAIAASPARCSDADVVRRELTTATRIARYAAGLLPIEGAGPQGDPGLPPELLDELREAWLLRSRPGGLERTVANYTRRG